MSATDKSCKSSSFDASNAWAIRSSFSHRLRLAKFSLSLLVEDFFRREVPVYCAEN
jgi:hypothetical protein